MAVKNVAISLEIFLYLYIYIYCIWYARRHHHQSRWTGGDKLEGLSRMAFIYIHGILWWIHMKRDNCMVRTVWDWNASSMPINFKTAMHFSQYDCVGKSRLLMMTVDCWHFWMAHDCLVALMRTRISYWLWLTVSLYQFLYFLIYIFLFFFFPFYWNARAGLILKYQNTQIKKKSIKKRKQKKKILETNKKINLWCYGTFSPRWIVIPRAWQTQLFSSSCSQNDHSLLRKYWTEAFSKLFSLCLYTTFIIFTFSLSTILFSFDPVNDILRYFYIYSLVFPYSLHYILYYSLSLS